MRQLAHHHPARQNMPAIWADLVKSMLNMQLTISKQPDYYADWSQQHIRGRLDHKDRVFNTSREEFNHVNTELNKWLISESSRYGE